MELYRDDEKHFRRFSLLPPLLRVQCRWKI